MSRMTVVVFVVSIAAALGVRPASAQLAPTGAHYAGRPSDTGHGSSPSDHGGYATVIPMDFPPARGALPVPVQIVSGGRGFGAAGVGWDVPLSFVHVDSSYARGRPLMLPASTPTPVQRISVSLPGRRAEMVRDGARWVGRHAPDLSLKPEDDGSWTLFDGNGLTYRFTQDPHLFGTGGSGPGGLYLLDSVEGPGNARVKLTYSIRPVTIANANEPAISIDLTSVRYNPHPSQPDCFKHEVALVYGIPLDPQPQSFSVVGERVLVRDHRLVAVDVKSRASCATPPARLRRYVFSYELDPDTRQERLAKVTMTGRDGTPEAGIALPVAAYGYGSATTTSGGTPVLRYQKTQSIPIPAISGPIHGSRIAGTWKVPAADFQSPFSHAPVGYASKQTLTDFTGDGRPDLVFPGESDGKLRMLRNLPAGGGATMLSPPATAPLVNDSTFTRRVLDASSSAYDRFHPPPPHAPNYDYVWTQTLDVNGDGRMDIIDAAEKPDHWVVYLNTPGSTPSGITWVRRAYRIDRLYSELALLGHAVQSHYLPLSRRYTSRDYDVPKCWKWDSSTPSWVLYPEGLGFIGPCGRYAPGTEIARDEQSFVEWEVRDINGDGYPDFVFNSSPVGIVSNGLVPPQGPPLTDTDYYRVNLEEFRVRPIAASNDVRAMLNIRGVFVTDGINEPARDAFSTWRVLIPNTTCGVGQSTTVTQTEGPLEHDDTTGTRCGFLDVNGDGMVDRITGARARLGTGFGFSTVAITLPNGLVQHSTHQHECVELGHNTSVSRQVRGLRDLTGDGIPDFVEWKVPFGAGYQVHVGTGAGFAPPIDIVADPNAPQGGFDVSRTDDSCYDHGSSNNGGLFDLDADGKPERLTLVPTGSGGWAIDVWQLVGGSGPGIPEAGRLVAIDNGHGAVTTISYRSAKHDTLTAHQVPYPEIVVSKVVTTGQHGFGGSVAETSYAYGNVELHYDSVRDVFRSAGYRRTVERTITSGTGYPGFQATATIVDRFPVETITNPTVLLYWTSKQLFGRYLRAGQVSEVTVLARAIDVDAWALLNVDVTTDPRRIAQSRFDVNTQDTKLAGPSPASRDECIDMTFPYDYSLSKYYNGSRYDTCSARGFLVANAGISWRGTAAPPAGESVQTIWDHRVVDDMGRTTSIRYRNDAYRLDDDFCVDTVYANPTSQEPRVLFAAASRKVWGGAGCSEGSQLVFAEESWEYDKLYWGSVSQGLLTAHTIYRHATDTGAYLNTVRDYDVNYDALANPVEIIKTRAGATRTMRIDYDEFGLVSEQSSVSGTNVPTLDTYYSTDPVSGELLATTDPNGTVRGTVYDGFGRPVLETIAGPSSDPTAPSGVLLARRYIGFEGGHPDGRHIVLKAFPDPVPQSQVHQHEGRTRTTYFDELGRQRYSLVELGDDYGNEQLVVGARVYDPVGRVQFEADSFPRSQDPNLADGITAYGTTNYYATDGSLWVSIRGTGLQPFTTIPDASLERYPTVYRHSFANHTESMAMQTPDSLTLGTPQYGVIREAVATGAGRIVARSTVQYGRRLEYAELAYDPLGRGTRMTRYQDPASPANPVTWSWTFDSVGQLLSISEPSTPLQLRSYSDWGELDQVTWNVQPSRSIVNSYDAYGRLVHSEEQNGGVTDPATVYSYSYDAPAYSPLVDPTHVLGRLAFASGPTGSVALSYDALGNVNARSFIDRHANVYVEQHRARGDGSPAWVELNLPDSNYAPERVEYAYDTAGHIRSMWFSDGANMEDLYQADQIDPWGRLRHAVLGRRVEYVAAYAAVGRRLPQYVKVAGDVDARYIDFRSFDPVGRELARIEQTSSSVGDHSYSYDALGRLNAHLRTSGGVTMAQWGFTYDPLGNVTRLSDNVGAADATLSYLTTDRDRICRIGYGNGGLGGTACNVGYDSFGNIVEEPTRTGYNKVTYSNAGDTVRIENEQGVTATFAYDPFGHIQELDIADNGQLIRSDRQYGAFIKRSYQLDAGGKIEYLSRHFPAPGVEISRRGKDGPWVFQFSDLRGARFSTDHAGAFVQDVEYTPYGEATATGALPATPEYSSRQWNDGDALAPFGLVHLGARIYDPVIGRFLSRDPLLVPRTSSTTNPYAFAFNDPINFADPTGLESGDFGGGEFDQTLWLPEQIIEIEGSAPKPDDLELAAVAGLIAVNSLREHHRQALWHARQNQSDTTWRTGPQDEWLRATDPDQFYAEANEQFSEAVRTDYERYRSSKAESWAKATRRMNTAAVIGKGIGLGVGVGGIATLGGGAYLLASSSPAAVSLGQSGLTLLTGGTPTAVGLSLLYGAIAPPGAPDLPGPGDDVGRVLNGPCFVAGTPVVTANGAIPIEDLEVGDLVLSRDPVTGAQQYRAVREVFVTPDQPVLWLTVRDADGEMSALGVTKSHPFWVAGRGWVPAGGLRPGDSLVTSTSDALEVVASVEGARTTVYNFEVDEFHTYFAGPDAAWVHNSCGFLSKTIAEEIGKLGLSAADKTAARKAVFDIIDRIAQKGLKTVDEIANEFPGNRVHELGANLKGWTSVDPVASNPWAFGGARLLVKRVHDGWEFMVKNTHGSGK